MDAVGRRAVDVVHGVAEREHAQRHVERQRVAGTAAVAIRCDDRHGRERTQRIGEALQSLGAIAVIVADENSQAVRFRAPPDPGHRGLAARAAQLYWNRLRGRKRATAGCEPFRKPIGNCFAAPLATCSVCGRPRSVLTPRADQALRDASPPRPRRATSTLVRRKDPGPSPATRRRSSGAAQGRAQGIAARPCPCRRRTRSARSHGRGRAPASAAVSRRAR